jgi:hypothetical protein
MPPSVRNQMLKATTDGQKKSVMRVTKKVGYNAVRTMTANPPSVAPRLKILRLTLPSERASRS